MIHIWHFQIISLVIGCIFSSAVAYMDCKDSNFDESSPLTHYFSIANFISTSDGKACKVKVTSGPTLNIMTRGVLNASPRSYYIRKLDLSFNGIETIKEDPFRSSGLCLVTLDLSHNNISDIETGAFSQLKFLQKLDLSYNKIKSFESSAFPVSNRVDYLDLSYNKFDNIDFLSTFVNVTTLYLRGNNLSLKAKFFKDLIKLSVLSLENCNISNIPLGLFEGVPSLKELYLGKNKLSSFITGTFSGIKYLELLNISYNQLTSDAVINDKVMFPISKLKTLILDGNNMTDLNATALNRVLPYMSYIGVGFMPWNCDKLLEFFQLCHRLYIDMTKHTEGTYTEHNIHGVKCLESGREHDDEEEYSFFTTTETTSETLDDTTNYNTSGFVTLYPVKMLTIQRGNENSSNDKLLVLLEVLCVCLFILVVVLSVFVVFKDRVLNICRKKVYQSHIIQKYSSNRSCSTITEPECDLSIM